ncbi:uncharacterized protein [Choristoneura fumiferana]|uniref:uncharacterized protein n=1 Tax=Choristoneura fumiferana TaxID=7141 RepID=UPI003D15604C
MLKQEAFAKQMEERGAEVSSEQGIKMKGTKIELQQRPHTEGAKNEPSRKSTSSSVVLARRIQLELEAAEAKAKIEKELIDKRLAAELVALELQSRKSDKSYGTENSGRSKVEAWIDRSQRELGQNGEQWTGHVGDKPVIDRYECPPAPPLQNERPSTDIEMLACALKDAINASTSKIANRETSSRFAESRDMPLYFGDPIEWLQFQAAFKESSMLYNFTDTENIYRLRKCLRGEAKEAVVSMLIGNTKPEVIMQTLKLRFGRPELIINKIVAQIKRLPPLPHAYHNEIVNFATKIKNFAVAALAINQSDYLRSPELITTVISKFPSDLIHRWSDYAYRYQYESSTKTKFEMLTDFLVSEATKASVSGVSHINSQADTSYRRRYEERRGPPIPVLISAEEEKCRFCSLAVHRLPDCSRFKRAMRRDRWRFVRANRLCFKCLILRHDKDKCSASACDVDGCGQNHHKLLHYKIRQDNVNFGASVHSNKSSSIKSVEEEDEPSEVAANTTTLKAKVLLKVVPLTIHGPTGTALVYALLDDGATLSLLSADLANTLGLHGCIQKLRVRGAWDNTELLCNNDKQAWMELHSLVRNSFALEAIGVTTKPRQNKSELRAMAILDETAKLHNGQWEVGLPWKSDDALPDSYPTAYKRLGEIDTMSNISEWHYVPSTMNVADAATKEKPYHLHAESEWYRGPAFLYSVPDRWPAEPETETHINEENLEKVNTVCIANSADLPVPEATRFSSWLRLRGAAASVLKFISKCDTRKKWIQGSDCIIIKKAESLLFRQAQVDSFAKEIVAIRNNKNIERNSKLISLSPFLDECDVLRVGGRIGAAAGISDHVKHPIILDGQHHVTRLIVKYYHVRAAHANRETVVNELKQKFWIVRMRPTVKSVAAQCMTCRIQKAKPQMPRMGDLPAGRMAHHQRPFSHCGLDLFGPMEVTIGRRREKRYGVLFTCLTIRGVHIEIVNSLTTDSLIMALRRMAARRGWPAHLYSDNGTNLKGADAELKRAVQEIDEEALKNFGAINNTDWTFIPPVSPHWGGGAWERLIRNFKTALKVVLKERAPRDETLATLIAEVENMINSRPLTHVSVEPGTDESITPNHFLIGPSSSLPVPGVFDDTEFYLRKQWRIAQRLADMYWKRWVREVLPEMLPRGKWHQARTPLKIGDLVLIVDPDSPRNTWPRGIIISTYPGKDGQVRVVLVKTKSGLLKRSVSRIALIPTTE